MENATTQRGKPLALTGALFQLGLLLPLPSASAIITPAFEAAFEGNGGEQNRQVDAAIYQLIVVSVGGFTLWLIGLGMLALALVSYRYRAPWFFWFLVIYGGLLLLGFPIGTVVGISFLVYCLPRRLEFLPGTPTSLDVAA